MTLISRIADAIATDDDDQSERLIETYKAASKTRKAAIDDVMICLCGYSIPTLMDQERADGN
jgi:hypothetical protein